MLFDVLILICCERMNEERTASAIFHLLTGRRSTQTVQDAHIFHLTNFYGIHPSINKNQFDVKVKELCRLRLIEYKQPNTIKILPKGISFIRKQEEGLPITYFRGLKHFETAKVFYERILILIQVLTNKKMRYSSYIPVVDKTSVLNWLKQQLYRSIQPVEEQLQTIHVELNLLLKHVSSTEAELFVDRLTGYKSYGLSVQQLASTYKMDFDDVSLLLVAITHRLLSLILADFATYPFLSLIIKDLSTNGFITKSADYTNQLVKKQFSIEKVAQIRRLKISTICDHLVEIALYDPTFPIKNYVGTSVQQQILLAIKKTNSMKLKVIKEHVNPNISYFQIRLTLAAKFQ